MHRFQLYRVLTNSYKRWSIRHYPFKEIERCYKIVFGNSPNLSSPKNLIEKIYWMELFADLTEWTKCEDKYKMRDYIDSKGLSQYLPRLLGHWEDVDSFSLEHLPKSFVLKSNNGCGTVLVIRDKNTANERVIKKTLKEWLRTPYGYTNAGLHYLAIKPCIIAEELLSQNEEYSTLSPNALIDFKVYCINGEPKCIWVAYDRNPPKVKSALYDTNWIPLTDKIRNMEHYVFCPEIEIPRPKCLDEMLRISSILSQPLPQMRVDFYVIHDKPVIGELTLATGYGFFTEQYYEELGKEIDLSKVKLATIPNYQTI